MADAIALPDLLLRAGAVMTLRHDRPVAAHYGSPAGELSVCIKRAGLAVRSDLRTLSIRAGASTLDRVVERTLQHQLMPGGAAFHAGAWWCRSIAGDELVVICQPTSAEHISRHLRKELSRFADGELRDSSADTSVLAVIGHQAPAVLDDLGAFGPSGDPHAVPPFFEMKLGERRVRALFQTRTAVLVLADVADAAEVWRAIERAGRRHGISCVGAQSIDRYLLTQRAGERNVAVL